ncbi:hypothetical protein [Runella aurantiaca]|uniref:DUF4440 domain-containing protein n=1 Tax=Runella aurantiaca TaxID=2282308 RepID=A0A369IAD0_9BACT|nr:hypothetical protein [Runella aurantiaca]RDB05982.1 hypothetical protein DVG78_11285 [Runella aurantiaca]
MKNLFFVLLLASGCVYAQTEEDTIKATLLAEAKALKAHQPNEVRKYWSFDATDNKHTIVSVNLPDGTYTSRTGADFAGDDAFPPAMPLSVSNADFRIKTAGTIAAANYQTTYTAPDGKAIKAHRVVLLEKVGKDWKITAISEHYYLPK